MRSYTILALFLLGCAVNFAAGQKKIVCYHTNWSQYRPDGGKFYPENIDANMCTHIIYAFAKMSGGELAAFEWNDESTDWSRGMYARTMDLKKKNPSLKILLAVGGWNMASTEFSNMVHDTNARRNFITKSIAFLKTHGFDGLDLDWEYPSNREGSRPSDRGLFTTLVKELKTAYAPHGFLLTAAVAAGKETIDSAYEVANIARDLDFINLMAYDLHGAWEPFTGHHSALYARPDETDAKQRTLNVDFAVKYWIQKGTPREKLILGLATYGRAFALRNANDNGMGSPATGAGSAGTFTREAGFLAYYEICQKLKEGWSKGYNNDHRVPYAHGSGNWVGYEDTQSLTHKVNYIKSENLGGAMFWALDLDDFDGRYCGQGKFPLINSVKAQLNSGGIIPTARPPVVTTDSNVRPVTTESRPITQNPVTQNPKLKCPKGDGYYPDLESGCTKYYACLYVGTVHERIQEFACQSGLLFDSVSKTCNYANQVKCQ